MNGVINLGFVTINEVAYPSADKSAIDSQEERLSELFHEIKEQYIDALKLQRDGAWEDSIDNLSALIKSSKLSRVESKGYKQVCNKIRFFSLKNLALAYLETKQYKKALDHALDALEILEKFGATEESDESDLDIYIGGCTRELLYFLFSCSFNLESDTMEFTEELVRMLLKMDPLTPTSVLEKMVSICSVYGEFRLADAAGKRLGHHSKYPRHSLPSMVLDSPLYNVHIKPSMIITPYTTDQQTFASWDYVLSRLTAILPDSYNERFDSSIYCTLISVSCADSTAPLKPITASQEEEEEQEDSIGTRVSKRRKYASTMWKKQSWSSYLCDICRSVEPILPSINMDVQRNWIDKMSTVLCYLNESKASIYFPPQATEDETLNIWLEQHNQQTFSIIDILWDIVLFHAYHDRPLHYSNRKHILKILKFLFPDIRISHDLISSKPIDQVRKVILYSIQILLYDTLLLRHRSRFLGDFIYPDLIDTLLNLTYVRNLDNHEGVEARIIYYMARIIENSPDSVPLEAEDGDIMSFLNEQKLQLEMYKFFAERRYDKVLEIGAHLPKTGGGWVFFDPFVLIEASWSVPDRGCSLVMELLQQLVDNMFGVIQWNVDISWVGLLDKIFNMISDNYSTGGTSKLIVEKLTKCEFSDLAYVLLTLSWAILDKGQELKISASFPILIWYYYILHTKEELKLTSQIIDLICDTVLKHEESGAQMDIKHKFAILLISSYPEEEQLEKSWRVYEALYRGLLDKIEKLDNLEISDTRKKLAPAFDSFVQHLSFSEEKEDIKNPELIEKFIFLYSAIMDSSVFKYNHALLTDFMSMYNIQLLSYSVPDNLRNQFREFPWISNAALHRHANSEQYSRLFYFKAKYLRSELGEAPSVIIEELFKAIALFPNDYKSWSMLYDVYEDDMEEMFTQSSGAKIDIDASISLMLLSKKLFKTCLMLIWLDNGVALNWYTMGEAYWRFVSQPFIGYVYSAESDNEVSREWIQKAMDPKVRQENRKLAFICYNRALALHKKTKGYEKSFCKDCIYMMGKCIGKIATRNAFLLSTKCYYESCTMGLDPDNYYRFVVSVYKSYKRGYITQEQVREWFRKVNVTDEKLSCDIWKLFIFMLEEIIALDKKGLEHRPVYRIARIMYEDMNDKEGWTRLSTLFHLKPGKQIFLTWKTPHER